jgi:voltage-gated potassium channel
MFPGLRALARDPEGKVLLVGAVAILAVGTVTYHFLEGWSFVDSLYFSVVTLATVGFGDLHPTTEVSRLFTIGYILTGIGILAGFVSELSRQRRVERRRHGEDATGGAGAADANEGATPGDGPTGGMDRWG